MFLPVQEYEACTDEKSAELLLQNIMVSSLPLRHTLNLASFSGLPCFIFCLHSHIIIINATRQKYFVCCCEHDWSRRPGNETVPQLVVLCSDSNVNFTYGCPGFLSTWKLHSTLISQASPSVVGPS